MKIRKKTIVFIVIAVLCLIAFAGSVTGSEDSSGFYSATYVEGAEYLEENEGKLICISGNLEVIENAKDTDFGIDFPSPKVSRKAEQVNFSRSDDQWHWVTVKSKNASDGFEDANFYGRVKVGDFELDQELVIKLSLQFHDVMKEDFSDSELADLESRYLLVKSDGLLYVSEIPFRNNMDEDTYYLHTDWDGKRRARWNMGLVAEDQMVTVVGVQNGNTITCGDTGDDRPVQNGYISSAEYEEGQPAGSGSAGVMLIVLAVVFAALAVLSMRKKE